jgi:hypothetical protein
MTIPPRKPKRPTPKPAPAMAAPIVPPGFRLIPPGNIISDADLTNMKAAFETIRDSWQKAFTDLENGLNRQISGAAQAGADAALGYVRAHPERLAARVVIASWVYKHPDTGQVIGTGFRVLDDLASEP